MIPPMPKGKGRSSSRHIDLCPGKPDKTVVEYDDACLAGCHNRDMIFLNA